MLKFDLHGEETDSRTTSRSMRSLGVSRSVLVLAVAVPWLAGGAASAIALLDGHGTLAAAGLFLAAFGAVAAAELFGFGLGQPRVPRTRRRAVISAGGALTVVNLTLLVLRAIDASG